MLAELPNFDTLRYLAEHDPERLERLRRVLTERLIARAPERSKQRLRGLQFEIDARISLAPNPIAACVALSSMMHDTFGHLARALNSWQDDEPPEPLYHATILPFRSCQSDSSNHT
jgi:hypothetical protein